jgi:hypothetical protein
MRPIDADELKNDLLWLYDYDYVTTKKAIDSVDSIRTLDVEPVRHGKWELETWAFHGSRYESVFCSECRNMADGETPYCPYCGAKMDGN